MTVKELIEKLEIISQDAEIIMFDGTTCYTPSMVYTYQEIKSLESKVIIE